MQSKALGCLCNLCSSDSARQYLHRAEALDSILSALVKHGGVDAVARKGLNVLQVLCCAVDRPGWRSCF